SCQEEPAPVVSVKAIPILAQHFGRIECRVGGQRNEPHWRRFRKGSLDLLHFVREFWARSSTAREDHIGDPYLPLERGERHRLTILVGQDEIADLSVNRKLWRLNGLSEVSSANGQNDRCQKSPDCPLDCARVGIHKERRQTRKPSGPRQGANI